jgi:hypothetical protein
MPFEVRRFAAPMFGVVLGAAVGIAVGEVHGFRRGFDLAMGFLETEVKGGLSVHVEAASCVRVGDTERALKLLDTLIDGAVTSVAAQAGPLRAKEQLSQAKLYRSVVPATGAAASEVETALARIPTMELPSLGAPRESGLVRLARQGKS